MSFYPKNFDPAIFLGIDGADPEPDVHEPWSSWCSGHDLRIPSEFVLFCWWHFTDALSTFIQWDSLEGEWPPEYSGGGELAQERFRKELGRNFQIVGNLIGEAWLEQPFILESRMGNVEKRDAVKLMCAYSVMCMDDGISALYDGNPIKSSAAFTYAIRGLELAHEYRDAWDGKRDKLRQARTAFAKEAAAARHSMPGGAWEKRNAIREIWLSGKYTSRDICAEQECAALGMSFSTARKALRGTPTPT